MKVTLPENCKFNVTLAAKQLSSSIHYSRFLCICIWKHVCKCACITNWISFMRGKIYRNRM